MFAQWKIDLIRDAVRFGMWFSILLDLFGL